MAPHDHLASAQFVMVLDSSVMNVAISQIVEDLNMSIQGVQTAITLYTLVMQGTAQNLGSSLGTATIGAVLLASLATGFSERSADNPNVPAAARQTIVAKAEKGIDIVPVAAAEKAAVDGGLTEDQARAVAADYGDAQLDALRLALGAVALIALLSLWFTRGLPTRSLGDAEGAVPELAPVAGVN